jgi:sugar transferase (PEP-CTERM/EpsH1 system associated)
MARILFLAHRIPYPPNKGDKIRSWHMLEHLCQHHDVHLAYYIDDPRDLEHTEMLAGMVESQAYCQVSKREQKVRALTGFLSGKPLTVAAYPKGKLRRYCNSLLDSGEIDVIFLFSGAVAPLVFKRGTPPCPVVTDLVDVDSAKWQAYSGAARWPMNLLYQREHHTLAAYEREIARRSVATLFVSEDEAALFRKGVSADVGSTVHAVMNGVDLARFDPTRYGATREQRGQVIFTGAMDYAPNIEAARWFVRSVWPHIRAQMPEASFVIAGGPVGSAVKEMAKTPGVSVLGYVDDMAATIAKAQVAVAPLLTARGIQNKVLEGMAMAKPVVATRAAKEGIVAEEGRDLLVADDPAEFAQAVLALLKDAAARSKVGADARRFVERHHSWPRCLEALDGVIAQALAGEGMAK